MYLFDLEIVHYQLIIRCLCVCVFWISNGSSNSDYRHGGGVPDPEIVIGDEEEDTLKTATRMGSGCIVF